LFFSPIYSDTDLVFLVNEHSSWGAKVGIQDTVPIDGDPKMHPKYIQNAIKGVGVFGFWGGPFRLDQQIVNGMGVDSILLEREEFHLGDDPLKDQDFALNLVYKSRSAAEVALSGSGGRLKYAFYVGPGELIYPTVISETTAPALCATLRKVVEIERTNAQAAVRLMVDLLLWWIGARFLPKTGKLKPNFATSASVGSGSTSGGKQALVFVEIGAGDLKASIDLAKHSGAKVVAVDPIAPAAEAIRELEAVGGTFIKGTAESLSPGIADKVLQYFPWNITGTGRNIAGGTWRLVEDTLRLLKPNGAAYFVTEELATAEYLVQEAGRRGTRVVLTQTTKGAAAPAATGAGVPDVSNEAVVWLVTIYM
jgi:hypothetical protein